MLDKYGAPQQEGLDVDEDGCISGAWVLVEEVQGGA